MIMKRIMPLIMSVMILSTQANAQTKIVPTTSGNEIVISNKYTTTGLKIEDKTFELYKIFEVAVSSGKDKIEYELNSNFSSFNNGGDTALFDEQYVLGLTDDAKMQELAKNLNDFIKTQSISPDEVVNKTSGTFNNNASTSTETLSSGAVADGYYLVLDKTTGDGVLQSAISAGALVTVPALNSNDEFILDSVIEIKASKPTIDKQIWHNDENEWEDVADHQIGDDVKFKIHSTLPTDVTGYGEYSYTITDTMSEGLTLQPASIKLFSDSDLTHHPINTDYYTITNTQDRTFTIEFKIFKDDGTLNTDLLDLANIYISYTATLNEDAKTYVEPAKEYDDNNVTLTYSNNPYDNTSKGKVEDNVYHYTYKASFLKTKNTKVDPLEGATFTLYKTDATNPDEQIYLEKSTTITGVDTYYAVSQQSDLANNLDGTITTNATGRFEIIGIDDYVEYKLVETGVPAGFHEVQPIIIYITSEFDTSLIPVPTVTVAGSSLEIVNGVVDGIIVNSSAILLPETGGIGTTMFYIAGTSLVLTAVYMIISRRRHN